MHIIKWEYSVQENNPTGICGSFWNVNVFMCVLVNTCLSDVLWSGRESIRIISNGIEYFDIVHSEGDVYISILYICDENALAFCANTICSLYCCWTVSVLMFLPFCYCTISYFASMMDGTPFFVTVKCCKEISQVSLELLLPELICMNGT